jgi:NTP pyrophosphatase (non-canonical NTP hydrolase)
MDFNTYAEATEETAVYKTTVAPSDWMLYETLGLVGEAGEFADKVKKILRDHGGVIDDEARDALVLELGDVLWYLARLAIRLGHGWDLSSIAERNLAKLAARQERGTLHGAGDER